MQVNEAIFRDYDIRGIVDKDLNTDFAYGFGQAFGTWLKRKRTQDILVGFDARASSPDYFDACVKGLLTTGIHVIKIGMVTTGMLYWARKYYKIDGGLSITASHNPPEYNGFKPCSGNGALFGPYIQEIKVLMMNDDFDTGEGSQEEREIHEDYYNDIASKVHISKPMSVIVDCGNATAGPFVPVLLRKLGMKVEELYCDLDPTFPHHPPDPVDPRAYPDIQAKMADLQCDAGLLFDGDADRLGAIDQDGAIIRGDQITALCARTILAEHPGEKILFEVQCSKSGTDDVEAHGGIPMLIRVGHSYIEKALIDEKAALAGETSGHIFFEDRWYGFDDAIYAACRFLEHVASSGKSVKECVASLPYYVSTPQTRFFAPDNRKFVIVKDLQEHFKKMADDQGLKALMVDGVRIEWPDGWACIRASNTQPQLTVRAEATSEARLKEIKKIMEVSVAAYKNEGVAIEWGKVH